MIFAVFRCTIRFPNTSIKLVIHAQLKLLHASNKQSKHPDSPGDQFVESPQHLSDVEDTKSGFVNRVIPSVSTNRRKQLLTSVATHKSLIVDKSLDGSCTG